MDFDFKLFYPVLNPKALPVNAVYQVCALLSIRVQVNYTYNRILPQAVACVATILNPSAKLAKLAHLSRVPRG